MVVQQVFFVQVPFSLRIGVFVSLCLSFFVRAVIAAVMSLYGDEEARTPDLRRAKAALSQLSYIPSVNPEL